MDDLLSPPSACTSMHLERSTGHNSYKVTASVDSLPDATGSYRTVSSNLFGVT